MFLKEIVALLEKKLSPKSFSLRPEIYGIQYGDNNENKLIRKVIITLDLSLEAIHYAIKKKVNLIISYNGLINKTIKIITIEEGTNLLWNNVEIINGSATIPEGTINEGDMITNCTEILDFKWIPTNKIFLHCEFVRGVK